MTASARVSSRLVQPPSASRALIVLRPRRPAPRRACSSLLRRALSSSSMRRRRVCASTVRRSGSTSATPLLTNMRVWLPLGSVTSMMPGRSAEMNGAWPGQHGEFALGAGHHHLARLAREHHALGRHQLELECRCHLSTCPVSRRRRCRRSWRDFLDASAAWCRRTGRRTADGRPCWVVLVLERRPGRPTCRARRPRPPRSAARTPRPHRVLELSQQPPNLRCARCVSP